jgi:hypothetical protein
MPLAGLVYELTEMKLPPTYRLPWYSCSAYTVADVPVRDAEADGRPGRAVPGGDPAGRPADLGEVAARVEAPLEGLQREYAPVDEAAAESVP